MCGHTLITVGAALLIPAFEHLHTVGWNALDRLFVGIALVSYSAYLYHTMMETWLVRQFGYSDIVAHVGIISGSISIVDIWCSMDELSLGGSATVAVA
jgi:peptidoglycan/LPS O-acetylase OafA/YrhL